MDDCSVPAQVDGAKRPGLGGVVKAFASENRSRILAVAASLAITIAIIAFRDQLAALSGYGYLGVFLISLLGNATVVLPVPSLAVVFAGGGVLNPILVGLVAGLGEPLGELTGYLAGYGGSAVVEETSRYGKIQQYMASHGMLTIFVLSAIPNPLFDLAGIVAGMSHMPVWKFLLPCWLGKTIKALAIAHIGSVSIDLFSGLFG
ncbi:MAG: VTT domain-containing protein [Chloroflexi bacterium]|nr:VTT domain-containing protein [Chloroflexota bacterium]